MENKRPEKRGKHRPRSRIKRARRWVQAGVAASFILIPWLNSRQISIVQGNFLCFDLAGIPLADPLAVLQIVAKNGYLSMDLFLGAGIALVLALVLGTVFCSWVCPFGLFSDLGQTLGRRLGKRRPVSPGKTRDFSVKFTVFAAGIAGLFIFSTTPVLNQFSLPAWYSRVFQFLFVQHHLSLAGLFILLVPAVEAVTQKRIWCRYICPQSVLLILVKQLNPGRLKVRFHTDRCFHPPSGKSPCARACTLGLDPKSLPTGWETQCTNCGDCITACSGFGSALKFGF